MSDNERCLRIRFVSAEGKELALSPWFKKDDTVEDLAFTLETLETLPAGSRAEIEAWEVFGGYRRKGKKEQVKQPMSREEIIALIKRYIDDADRGATFHDERADLHEEDKAFHRQIGHDAIVRSVILGKLLYEIEGE